MSELVGYPYKPYVTEQFEEQREQLGLDVHQEIVAIMAWAGKCRSFKPINKRDAGMRGHNFTNPACSLNADSATFSWFTEEFLEMGLHNLLVESEGSAITYTREPVNVDCQKIPSLPIALRGIEEVSTNNDAVYGLMYGLGTLRQELVKHNQLIKYTISRLGFSGIRLARRNQRASE